MQDNESNRMATAKNRGGRPTKTEVAARGEAQPVVEPPHTLLPSIKPMLCVLCKRGMVPRVIRTGSDCRTVLCSLCNGKMMLTYAANGTALANRL